MQTKIASGKTPHLLLATRLGHTFADAGLLQRALTHRSFSADHNERLEFLGDSVLSLAVSSLLYARLQKASEGELSRIRANLVKQESLYQIALKLDLASAIRLGEGELRSGGLSRPSILADALEAVLGAVYLDAGYQTAEALIHRLFAEVDISATASAVGKDAKTALQEWLQARKMPVPHYKVENIEGQAHRQLFKVVCSVEPLRTSALGSGNSRRAAEQDAAAKVLQQLLAAGAQASKSGKAPLSRPAKVAKPAQAAQPKALPDV